jgi:hypothetical protein
LQFGGKDVASKVAILDAKKLMKGVGLSDRAELEGMVLRKGSVYEGRTHGTSVDHCSCLDKF